MLAGQAADLVMDTAPSLARDVRDGKSAGQIAASTIKNLGVNAALNVVGEEIPYLWSAGRQALRGMRSGTQNAAEAAVRTAQNAADALDAAKALPSRPELPVRPRRAKKAKWIARRSFPEQDSDQPPDGRFEAGRRSPGCL